VILPYGGEDDARSSVLDRACWRTSSDAWRRWNGRCGGSGRRRVKLTDLLAVRASDHVPAALEGDPEALRAIEREAERLLETEDIQHLA
jgi:hypothetical protein